MELKKIKGGGISQAAIDEIGALDFVGSSLVPKLPCQVLTAVQARFPRFEHEFWPPSLLV